MSPRLLIAGALALLALACAQNGAAPRTAAVRAPAPGDATLSLELRNQVATLGPMSTVVAVLDGVVVMREGPWEGGHQRTLSFATTPGRHHLCIAASYPGTGSGEFEARATRLVDLISGSTVSLRVTLEEHLGPTPVATANIQGGTSYEAATGPTDHTKDVTRVDEICAVR